jgi:hypothetical protein
MALAESATSLSDINARFRKHRIRVMLAITLGYGFIYTCRLGLSIVKKPVIDNGIFTVEELGSTASCPTTSSQDCFSPPAYSSLRSLTCSWAGPRCCGSRSDCGH